MSPLRSRRDRRGPAHVPPARPRTSARAEPPEPPLRPAWALAVAAVLIVAWLALYLPQIAGRVFVMGDAPFYRGYGDFSYERWTQLGERTLWNPFVFFGLASSSSLADPRPQWLPDAMLTAWDALTRGPRGWLLGPPLLAQLTGMLAMAALARRLWRCAPEGMALAGLVWGLAPNLVVPFALGHDAQAIATGLMPAVLLGADVALTSMSPRAAAAGAIGMAAALALQVLGGHPQFVIYGLAALVTLTALRWRAAAAPGRVLLVAGGAALGLLMSAILWWPAWLYLTDTHRSEARFARGNARDFSLALRDFLALGWPRAVGWGGAGYWGGQRATDYANTFGMIAFPLAVWAAAGTRGPRAVVARGLGVLGLAAMVFALGPNLPGLGRVILTLPLISSFRTPSTWMVLAQLAGALLAALGWERLRALAAARPGAVRIAGAVVAAAALIALAARPALEQSWQDAARGGFRVREAAQILNTDENKRTFARVLPEASARVVSDLQLQLATLGLFLLAASWAPAGRSPARFALVSLLALIGLASVVVPETRRYTGPREELTPGPGPPFAQAAAADSLYRAYPLETALFFSNHWITWRARTVGGLHGAVPRLWGDVRRNNLLLWDGFVRAVAVRYVGGEQFELQDSTGYDVVGGVLRRRDALPRAYAVPKVVALAHDSLVVQRLARVDFDPTAVAYTTEGGAAGDYPGSAGAAIAWTRDDPDAIELAVRAKAPAFVVIADSWFRGWSATLDGAPVPIARVSHALRGVRVPGGEHRIAMRYVPAGWRTGRLATFAGWIVWAALLAVMIAAGTRRRAPDPPPSPA